MNNSFYTVTWHFIKFVLFMFPQRSYSAFGITHLPPGA